MQWIAASSQCSASMQVQEKKHAALSFQPEAALRLHGATDELFWAYI